MKTKTVFVAEDGKEFDTKEECRMHDDAIWLLPLVGLTLKQVDDMVFGKDAKLQRVLFDAYNHAKQLRREAGLVKTRKKAA